MNEELIRQCAREGAAKAWEDCEDIPPAASRSLAQQARSGDLDDFEAAQAARIAIRLYHDRSVAPLVEADEHAHEVMHKCTAVLSANDAADVADAMQFLRTALGPFQKEGK